MQARLESEQETIVDDPVLKRGHLEFKQDSPMVISQLDVEGPPPATETLDQMRGIAAALREYTRASRELLQAKYQFLQPYAPGYLLNPGQVVGILCDDGLVVRFEKARTPEDETTVLVGYCRDSISTTAANTSQQVVHCFHPEEGGPPGPATGLGFQIVSMDPATGVALTVMSIKMAFHVPLIPVSNEQDRPFRRACVLNQLELNLEGRVGDIRETTDPQEFVARTPLRLPVGWDCIEVYDTVDLNKWTRENAPKWAEQDILTQAVISQNEELYFQSLDPRASARGDCARLLSAFKKLLDSNPREELLQSFLRDHPVLLCPAHTLCRPKVPFGSKVSDFVFREASGEYLLVEIERSSYQLFRKDGHPTSELTVAMGQTEDWKRYISDNISTVRGELKLDGITGNPRRLVVMGRSSELNDESFRKLKSMQDSQPSLRIMTYDSVLENARAVMENLFGPIIDQPDGTTIYVPVKRGGSK